MFSDKLEELVQEAFTKKQDADDGEQARKWAIVRTELEKIRTYVLWIESEEISNAS